MLQLVLSFAVIGALLGSQLRIVQGVQRARRATPARAADCKPAPASPMNLNTASTSELELLPGIDAERAQRIVEYRLRNGPFSSIDQLMHVSGMEESIFVRLRPYITVTD